MLLYSFTLYANTLPLGTLVKSNIILDVNGSQIETYSVFNTNYVAISQLKSAGFNVNYTNSQSPMYINSPQTISTTLNTVSAELVGEPYSVYTKDVYIGYLKTQALVCNGKVLIPIASLNQLYDTALVDNLYILSAKTEVPVLVNQTSITNYSDDEIQVTVQDLYWNDELIKKELYFDLQPGESLKRPASSDKTYLSSIITAAGSRNLSYKSNSLFGQVNESLLKLSSFAKTLPSNIGDKTDLNTLYWAYNTVNAQKLTSKTKYLVWTNLDRQKTFVFTSVDGKWQIVKHFVCSSGKPSTPTPTGTYKLTRKVPSFGQNKGYCCKNAFGFIGTTYLYHSIIFDKTGTYLLEGKGVLGKKASDGCIRLSPENSKWFYDHLISGSTVWIN